MENILLYIRNSSTIDLSEDKDLDDHDRDY